MIAVAVGVSGSGKTTAAALVAKALGWRFQEGDALHSPANVEKMRGGAPLTDADRLPWLRSIAGETDDWRARGERDEILRQLGRRGRAGGSDTGALAARPSEPSAGEPA